MAAENETRPITRLQHPDASVGTPSSCDLCSASLGSDDLRGASIEWRTPEKTVSSSLNAMTALTIFVGVTVRDKRIAWREMRGLYFLCAGCRRRLRPTLADALPAGLICALLGLVVGLHPLTSHDKILVIAWPGICAAAGFALGLFVGFRRRSNGYPAADGFRVYRTSFDHRHFLGAMVLWFALICAIQFTAIAWYLTSIDMRVAQAQTVDTSPEDRLVDKVGLRLTALAGNAGESRNAVGRAVTDAWTVNRTTVTRSYPEITDFLDELIRISSENKGMHASELATAIASESPGRYLARQNEGRALPPFATEKEFSDILDSLAAATGQPARFAARPLLHGWVDLKPLQLKLSLLDYSRLVATEVAQKKSSLDDATKAVFSSLASHPK